MKINGYEVALSEADLDDKLNNQTVDVDLIKPDFPAYRQLSDGDKKAFAHLVKAARMFNDVFLEQDHKLDIELKEALEDKAASDAYAAKVLRFFNSLNGVEGLNGIDKEPVEIFKGVKGNPGRNFYPDDLSAEELQEILIKMLEEGKVDEVKKILSVRTMVRRHGDELKAIDFTGSYVEKLGVAGRMVICNMAVEMGAKTAYMQPNQAVLDYVNERAVRPYEVQYTDDDFEYEESYVFDVSELEPQLACPHSVDNVFPLTEVVKEKEVKLDQGYIGSCTGGREEDIEAAAKILEGKHIPEYTRLVVVPASAEVMQNCMKKGYIQSLMAAGATITSPGCGACLGAHEGILAPGEVCITTTNRNFPGRMGSTEAKIYLASPATVASSILNGVITDPRKYL